MKDPILLAGVVAAFGCLFAKRTPVSLVERGCLYARASWLLAATMAEAAWERRVRWEECCERAWRERA